MYRQALINKFKRAHKAHTDEAEQPPLKWDKFYKDEDNNSLETNQIASIPSNKSISINKLDRNGEYHSDSIGSNLSLIPSIDTNRDKYEPEKQLETFFKPSFDPLREELDQEPAPKPAARPQPVSEPEEPANYLNAQNLRNMDSKL